MTTVINLIFINAIVALVFLSGFWDTLDEYVNKRFPLRHLPHLLKCGLCQTWWLSLLYIIIAGKITIPWIAICLLNAYLNDTMIALLTIIKNWINKILEWLIPR